MAGTSRDWIALGLKIRTIEPGEAPILRASSACDHPRRSRHLRMSAFHAASTGKYGPVGRRCGPRFVLGRLAPFRIGAFILAIQHVYMALVKTH